MQYSISRWEFIRQCSAAGAALLLRGGFSFIYTTATTMEQTALYDVIIIGGSYSGLAAAMALGRSLKKILVIDSGLPCNRQTPHSHNFLTQDGSKPADIAATARAQVLQYPTIEWLQETAVTGKQMNNAFEITTGSGKKATGRKLIFATGIKDLLPDIDGLQECWGISALHCPFCHGYEVRNEKTGLIGNGDHAFEMAKLLSNWTKDLTLYTNGPSALTAEQTQQLRQHNIAVETGKLQSVHHANGHIREIVLKNGTKVPLTAVYLKTTFEQHCTIPQQLGCELTEEGYIKTDGTQSTSIDGIFACGDNTTRMRTVANAVSMGTMAGIAATRQLVYENFELL